MARLAILLCLCACEEPRLTEILVVADTDLAVPEELASVRFSVVGPSGEEQVATADLASGARPAVLALVHRGGPIGPFVVEAFGESAAGETVVARSAEVSFAPGEVLVLPMHLLAECVGASCGELETCAEGGCRSRAIDPADLPRWTGEPPALDAGSGCTVAADCDDGIACTADACVDGACVATADDARCDADAHACTSGRCDPATGCVRSLDHALCDDAVACTVDRCDAGRGCVHAPSSALCDDGVSCTVDACDPLLGCSSSPDDALCDDGIACTRDRCDAVTACAHEADDTACDDGVSCTVDACDPTLGCTAMITPESCPLGERCDRVAGACAPAPTFTDVYAYLAASCVGACHDAGADGGLDLSTRELAYAALVGAIASCDASARVMPYDPARSLLWRKIARRDLCGERMPPSGPPADERDVATIEHWIAAGAPDN